MLDHIMIEYRKLRERLIGIASGTNDITYEEAQFYDKGYMQTRVRCIQKELKSVEDTLAGSIRSEKNHQKLTNIRVTWQNKGKCCYLTCYLPCPIVLQI